MSSLLERFRLKCLRFPLSRKRARGAKRKDAEVCVCPYLNQNRSKG